MSDYNLQYKIDASQILSKLHLSAIKSLKSKVNIYNSGICNMDDSADIINIKNVTFDVNNDTYEVGIQFLNSILIKIDYSFKEIMNEKEKIKISSTSNKYHQMIAKNNKDIQLSLKTNFIKAFDFLKKYISSFIGQVKSEEIDINSISTIILNENINSPASIKKYDNYLIPGIEINKWILKKMEENQNSKNFDVKNIVFKLKYKIERK